MNPKQALADLEKNKIWPVYFLYGDEPFKIDEFIALFQEKYFGKENQSEFSIEKIDATIASAADILEATRSYGLFGGSSQKRMVIVRNAHVVKGSEVFVDAFLDPAETPVVFISDQMDGRKKFHQWLKKQGLALEFKQPKDTELLQWTNYLAKKHGVELKEEASQILAVVCEGSLYRLSFEIKKAALFAHPEKKIGPEIIMEVASGKGAHEMIELVRAVLEAKRTRALVLSERLIHGHGPEEALGLVGYLTWAVRNPQKAGVGLSPERIRKMISALLSLDERLKTSGGEASFLVDGFILETSVST